MHNVISLVYDLRIALPLNVISPSFLWPSLQSF